MRVLVLSPALYDTAPGMRFRLEQWAPRLEAQGFHFDFVPFEDERLHRVLYERGRYAAKTVSMLQALCRRFAVLGRVREYDIVYLHREAALIGPAVLERIIAARDVPIVYDFDDPIWLPYHSPMNGFLSRLKFQEKTAAVCRLASAVIVGNRLLEGWASRYSRNVHVVPSTIDTDRYHAKLETAGEEILTLGWTGSHSTLPFLEPLTAILNRLAEQYRFRLLVISHTSSYRMPSARFEVVSRQWNAATEAGDIQQIDIGLGPFPNTGWTPWRCHGKVLQYMAAAIPTVASRIGILPDYIRDGQEGFLAATEEDWFQKLSLLMVDGHLRREMGRRARRTLEERYSAQVWAPRVAEILESAARAQLNGAVRRSIRPARHGLIRK